MSYYYGYNNKFFHVFQKAQAAGLLSKRVKEALKKGSSSSDAPAINCSRYVEFFDPKPQPDLEPTIAKSAEASYEYAKAIGTRFPVGEEAILKDGAMAFRYTRDVIKGRWEEAESVISTCREWGGGWVPLLYTELVNYRKRNKIRIPVMEEEIRKYPVIAIRYAKRTLKGRWEEAEPLILSNPSTAIKYAQSVTGPIPEVEESVKGNPRYAYQYAKKILKGRFEAGEAAIARNGQYSCWYAYEVLHSRFEAGEPAIKRSRFAAFYAINVIKGRWPEAELSMAKNNTWFGSYYARVYAKDILDYPLPDRWQREFKAGITAAHAEPWPLPEVR